MCPIVILVADFVPLANKGEEAIIRGIQDIFGGAEAVEVGMFGPVGEVTRNAEITVFPREWVYRVSCGGFSHRRTLLYNGLIAAQMCIGVYGPMRNLIAPSAPVYEPLGAYFDRSDCIIVGHDGVFCVESCGVIHLAKSRGKCVGVLGGGINPHRRLRPFLRFLYPRAIRESDFCYLRDMEGYEYMTDLGAPPDLMRVAPDPAFAMRPAPREQVVACLNALPWYRRAREDGTPVVGVTVCERSIVFTRSFLDLPDPALKPQVHSVFVAGILDRLVRDRNARILFLPHAIDTGTGDDRAVARNVIGAMKSPPGSALVIEEDLSARFLKGIVRECDFLIAERAHSAIASVAVGTPFIMMTNSSDRRSHGIFGTMCSLDELLLDMDHPDQEEVEDRVMASFDRRGVIRSRLEAKAESILAELSGVAETILART